MVTEGVVKHPTFAIHLGVNLRHLARIRRMRAFDSRSWEIACRQHIHAWIDVQIVLF